jgi:hypothetical protein
VAGVTGWISLDLFWRWNVRRQRYRNRREPSTS